MYNYSRSIPSQAVTDIVTEGVETIDKKVNMPKVEVTCDHCNNIFLQYPSNLIGYKKHYCSSVCKKADNGGRTFKFNYQGKMVPCEVCGKQVYKTPWELKFRYHFCSKVCRNGVAKQLSTIPNGREVPCNVCGKKIYRSSKSLRVYRKFFCSIACRKIDQAIYKQGPYRNFTYAVKNEIKARDGDKCRLCGSTKTIMVHHIDYDKRNSVPNNLITLCNSCHSKTNFNRAFWQTKLTYEIVQTTAIFETVELNRNIQPPIKV